MRIAFINQAYPPMVSGVSFFMEYLAQGMVKRGHDVLVIAASEIGSAKHTRQERLEIVRLRSSPNPLRANHHYVSWAYRRVLRNLMEFKPDVIHLHDSSTIGLAGVLAGKKLGIPTALTAHQLPWFVASYMPNLPSLKVRVERVLWDYVRWLGANVQALISPTETIADTIEQYAGTRPTVIANGIDLERFRPEPAGEHEGEHLCRKYGLDPALPVILHVGRLDVDKQVDLVVRAAAKTLRRSKGQLMVAGDGRQREHLVNLAARLGIGDAAHFPGFVSSTGDLPGLYRLASVFVTASEIEVQPLVLMEAVASGLPVVAVRATSIPEIVADGVNGCLVPPKDTTALADRIVDLIENPELARRMGLRGREISAGYSMDVSVEKHEAFYAALTARGRIPAAFIRAENLRKLYDRVISVWQI
ncbi:MAG TPA: glycosyltransferase [Anaerolineales bacterium]|nr:glycosyltransferase [Anaerolineales bacterium]